MADAHRGTSSPMRKGGTMLSVSGISACFMTGCLVVAGLCGGPAWPTSISNAYRVDLSSSGLATAHIAAVVLARSGTFTMAQGLQTDDISKHIAHMEFHTLQGALVPSTYDPSVPLWRVSEENSGPLRMSYDVDLVYLRTLPQWARLQLGASVRGTTYLTTKLLFVVPDSLTSREPVRVDFVLAHGQRLVTPWASAPKTTKFETTIASVAYNTIDVGTPEVVPFRHKGFDVQLVLLGQMAAHRAEMQDVIDESLSRYVGLFQATPPTRYVVTAMFGKEDAQAFSESASISTTPPILPDNRMLWANSVAHELFHFWNGRRIRPADRRLAFITEGFTEYYANRTIERAHLIDEQTYWSIAGRHLGSYAYFMYSPNYGIPLIDAAKDKTRNRFGVYDGGWTLALCLDLEILERSNGKRSLDDVMRTLWNRYGSRNVAYTYDDFVNIVNSVTGSNYAAYFARYVLQANRLPYERDLSYVGMRAFTQELGAIAYVRAAPSTARKAHLLRELLCGGTCVHSRN